MHLIFMNATKLKKCLENDIPRWVRPRSLRLLRQKHFSAREAPRKGPRGKRRLDWYHLFVCFALLQYNIQCVAVVKLRDVTTWVFCRPLKAESHHLHLRRLFSVLDRHPLQKCRWVYDWRGFVFNGYFEVYIVLLLRMSSASNSSEGLEMMPSWLSSWRFFSTQFSSSFILGFCSDCSSFGTLFLSLFLHWKSVIRGIP